MDTSAFLRMIIPDGPIPEGFDAFMRGVERKEHLALAPDLLWPEAASVLCKKEKRGELTISEGMEILALMREFPLRILAHGARISEAFTLAYQHDLTPYDALFLTCALEKNAVLFTADFRLQKVAIRLGAGFPGGRADLNG
ncbi:MAG: type II toxin-antitoxin system VapC family toxin [Verrucomicrobia bacterium]|nr:type II toxin-antitoxin system VapC family toxin [Verrucomicrobiota bacterium]